MPFQVDAALGHLHAFAFEEFALQGGVGFTDQELSASSENAVPGNALAARRCSHGMACGAGAPFEAQSFRDGPIR